MFGTVNIDKMELKLKEYYSYKGYYCGLCKCLKCKFGNKSRLTLNYDMTFLVLLLSSLYEPENKVYNERCIVHPIKKQFIIQNEITDYAASINILLSYYNLIDNWNDENNYKSFILSKFIKREYNKSSNELKEKNEIIKKYLDNIYKLEKENVKDIDSVSNEFGHLMEEIILFKKDEWEGILRKAGFFLGKFIYLVDAYIDMDEDIENNSYNPFNVVDCNNKEQYAKELLMLNLSFLSHEIEKLPLIQDKGIIDNIIYSGLLNKFNIQKRRSSDERSI